MSNAKATYISFSKNISIYAIFNEQSFNNTSTNDIVSFEQLVPDLLYFENVTEVLMLTFNLCGLSEKDFEYINPC